MPGERCHLTADLSLQKAPKMVGEGLHQGLGRGGAWPGKFGQVDGHDLAHLHAVFSLPWPAIYGSLFLAA